MGCFKFDKFDKIVISLTFIVVSMFSIFNCFCFASYETVLSPRFLFNCTLSSSTGDTGVGSVVELVQGPYFRIFELPAYYGYNYNFEITQTFSSGPLFFRIITFDDIVDYGSTGIVQVQDAINFGETKNINYKINDIKQEKIYFCCTFNGEGSALNDLDFTVTTDYIPNGFGDTINLLVENVSFSNLWSTFGKSIPFVLVVVLFVFGWWFFAHWVKELSKGRDF